MRRHPAAPAFCLQKSVAEGQPTATGGAEGTPVKGAFAGKMLVRQDGSAIVALILVFPFLILMAAYFVSLTASSFRLARADQHHAQAQLATDAGIDFSMDKINQDENWDGTLGEPGADVNGEIELQNSNNVRTTYETAVTDVDADTKTITSVGRSYHPAVSTMPSETVTIEVTLRPVTSGNFSLVTGVGGLIMDNSAKILGGDVYVNGEITMSNTAQIGLSTNPVNLNVAHQICPNPPDSTYPQICGPGNGEPINITNSAHIYGDVKANNQTTTTGMSDPGLTAGSGVVALPLPPHDRDAQKAAATTDLTGGTASCSNNQTRTWPANTKITGNVTVSNGCVVTIEGDVWITGTLSVSNAGSQLVVSDSLGATRPNIMIDGSVTRFRNQALLKSNTSGTGFQIITYRSSPSCSPDCADVTGQELYNSRNLVTIELENSAAGPNTIFYARWTRVRVNNSGQIGALVGQTVELRNSSTITFGTSLPGGGTTGWIIDGYRRVF